MQPGDKHSSALAYTDPSRIRDLSHALTFEKDSKDPHWNNKAAHLLEALATSPGATLNDARDIAVDKRRLEQAQNTSPQVDNVADEPKEWSYIRSNLARHVAPLSDTRVRRVFAGTGDTPQPTFRGEDGGRDIVIVRPHEPAAARESRYIIAILDALLNDAVAAGHAKGPGTKAILDEFASFLDLSKMRRYLDLGRGGRLQISYVLQGRGQLAAQVGVQEANSIIESTEVLAVGATSDQELAQAVAFLSQKQTVEYRGARETGDVLGEWKDKDRHTVEPGEILRQGEGEWTILQRGNVRKVRVPRKHYHFTQAAAPRRHRLHGVVSPATYAVPSLLGPEDDPQPEPDDEPESEDERVSRAGEEILDDILGGPSDEGEGE